MLQRRLQKLIILVPSRVEKLSSIVIPRILFFFPSSLLATDRSSRVRIVYTPFRDSTTRLSTVAKRGVPLRPAACDAIAGTEWNFRRPDVELSQSSSSFSISVDGEVYANTVNN